MHASHLHRQIFETVSAQIFEKLPEDSLKFICSTVNSLQKKRWRDLAMFSYNISHVLFQLDHACSIKYHSQAQQDIIKISKKKKKS